MRGIGTVVAELIVTIVQMYYTRKDFSTINIIGLSKNYMIASIFMFISCMLISKNIVDNTLSVLVQGIIGAIVYFAVLLIMKDEFLISILNKIKKRRN